MEHVWHFLIEDGLPFTGFVLSFFLVLFFHEYGHYIFSRLFNVRVLSLSVGYGWTLFSRKDKYDTEWTFHALPFVGGITIAGQGWSPDTPVTPDQTATEFERRLAATPESQLFRSKPAWKRLIIIIAGPVFNLILAFLLLASVISIVGEPVRAPYVTAVLVDGPADKAGFEPGDKVLRVNDTEIDNFLTIIDIVRANAGNELTFIVKRSDGQKKSLTVTPETNDFRDINFIQRSYPKIGILAQTKPMSLASISMVDGIETNKQEDRVRDLILENLDSQVVMKLKTIDGTYKSYRFHLRSNVNQDLLKPGSVEYESVFLGQFRDNQMQSYSLSESFERAKEETIRLIKGMASLPFNAIPFDKSLIKAETSMTGHDHPVAYVIYKIFYLGASMSVFLGLINLIPFPSFDGSRILSIFCSMFPKGQAIDTYVQRGVLTLFILSVIFANSLQIAGLQ